MLPGGVPFWGYHSHHTHYFPAAACWPCLPFAGQEAAGPALCPLGARKLAPTFGAPATELVPLRGRQQGAAPAHVVATALAAADAAAAADALPVSRCPSPGPASDTGCLWAPATSACASTSTSCGSGGKVGERVHGPSTQQRRQQQGRRSSAVTDELPAEPTDSFRAFIRGVQQGGSSGSSASSSSGSSVAQPVPAVTPAAGGAQQQQQQTQEGEEGQDAPASLPATDSEAALLSQGSAEFSIAACPSTCRPQPLLERWRQAMHSMLPSPAPPATAAKLAQGRGVLRAGAGRQLVRQGKGLVNDAAEDVQPKALPRHTPTARQSADENDPVLL